MLKELKEELGSFSGNRYRYLLFRISGVDTDTSRKLCGVNKGTYNSWLKNPTFVEVHRKIDLLCTAYRKEAINLLRRDNQLSAVMLEQKILQKMEQEISSGEYDLCRTNLAREVYSKLISDLDVVPQTQVNSWSQRIQNLIVENKENKDAIIEADVSQTKQLTEGTAIQEDKQGSDKIEEVSKEE